MPLIRFTGFITCLWVLSGCISTKNHTHHLKKIYDHSAQYHLPDRNPVIVIPGILGSQLIDQETEEVVWGAFRTNFVNPNHMKGAQQMSLPLTAGSPQAHDNVSANGVLEDIKLSLIGFPINIQAYAGILTTLGAGNYRDQTLGLNSIDYGTDHFTCFQFDYDWRRDISENAQALQAFIDRERVEIQRHYKDLYGIENAEVKFDIVAHSMGSLLTRYFMRYGAQRLPDDGSLPEITWAGAEDVERVILVAPPNAGSTHAFKQLLTGFNTGRPLLPHYSAALLGTFHSIYQLLPRPRHRYIVWDADITEPVDIFDPKIWQKYQWGLSAQDKETLHFLKWVLPDEPDAQKRQKIAQDFQAYALKRAKQFHDALDRPADAPDNLDLFLVAGDSKKTPQVISIHKQDGQFETLTYGVGDGTVLRSSALLDERVGQTWHPTLKSPINWEGTLFLFKDHRSLTSDPIFEDNVLYWLLEAPRN